MLSARLDVTLPVTSNWPPFMLMPPGGTITPLTVIALGLPRFASLPMLSTPALIEIWTPLAMVVGPNVLVPFNTKVPGPVLVSTPVPLMTLDDAWVRTCAAPTSKVPPVPTPAIPTNGAAPIKLKLRLVM